MTPLPEPDFAAVVDLARTAPSVHNTQPWRFTPAGNTLTIYADVARQLSALDPTARQLTISCGSALYLACLALRLQGFDVSVETHEAERRDSGADDELRLATVHVRPGAPATPEEKTLAQEAPRRHMNRGIFEPRPVDEAVVAAMRDAVLAQGAWVRFLDREEQVPLAVLQSRADQLERDDPAYVEELAAWTAGERTSDGVPREASGGNVSARASTLRLRQFVQEDVSAPAPDQSREPDDPPAAEHPLVAVIGTEGDERRDWLAAGQALSALLLRGAVAGVAASPLGQVIDLERTRDQLRRELGVRGEPQMVLRLGYAPQGPKSPRRGIDEVLPH